MIVTFIRYIPAAAGSPIIPCKSLGLSERPLIVPPEVLNASTSMLGLSRRSLFYSSYIFRYDRLNSSIFFSKVQAITKNFDASLTRIFVRMPFFLSRPFRLL